MGVSDLTTVLVFLNFSQIKIPRKRAISGNILDIRIDIVPERRNV